MEPYWIMGTSTTTTTTPASRCWIEMAVIDAIFHSLTRGLHINVAPKFSRDFPMKLSVLLMVAQTLYITDTHIVVDADISDDRHQPKTETKNGNNPASMENYLILLWTFYILNLNNFYQFLVLLFLKAKAFVKLAFVEKVQIIKPEFLAGYGWSAIIQLGIVIFGDRDLIAITIPNDWDLIKFFSKTSPWISIALNRGNCIFGP